MNNSLVNEGANGLIMSRYKIITAKEHQNNTKKRSPHSSVLSGVRKNLFRYLIDISESSRLFSSKSGISRLEYSVL